MIPPRAAVVPAALLLAVCVAGLQPATVAGEDGVAPAAFTRDAPLNSAVASPESTAGNQRARLTGGTPLGLPAQRALGEQSPLAARPQPPSRGPLPDWKLLLAVGAAFGVLIAFRGIAAVSKRRSLPLPPDVFEVLGEAPLGGGQAVRVVRFGPKTLLIAASASGCQTLAELSDPQATDRIAAACRGGAVQPRTSGRRNLVGVVRDSVARATA